MSAPTVEPEVLGPEFAYEVETLLARLGNTPTAVGRALMDAAVKGTPESLDDCALAVFLRMRGFDVDEVDPGRGSVTFGAVEWGRRRHWPKPAKLPGPARRFALGFDRGEWPELVRAGVGSC